MCVNLSKLLVASKSANTCNKLFVAIDWDVGICFVVFFDGDNAFCHLCGKEFGWLEKKGAWTHKRKVEVSKARPSPDILREREKKINRMSECQRVLCGSLTEKYESHRDDIPVSEPEVLKRTEGVLKRSPLTLSHSCWLEGRLPLQAAPTEWKAADHVENKHCWWLFI